MVPFSSSSISFALLVSRAFQTLFRTPGRGRGLDYTDLNRGELQNTSPHHTLTHPHLTTTVKDDAIRSVLSTSDPAGHGDNPHRNLGHLQPLSWGEVVGAFFLQDPTKCATHESRWVGSQRSLCQTSRSRLETCDDPLVLGLPSRAAHSMDFPITMLLLNGEGMSGRSVVW